MSATKVYAKFLTWTLFGVLLFVSYVWLQSWIISDRTMGFQHQMIRYQQEFIRGKYPHLENLDVLVVGDSTALQNILPPNLLDLKAASIAASGISAVEIYYILKRYLEAPVQDRTPPQCVLLMTSYGANHYHNVNFFWPLTVGHRLIYKDEALDLFRESEKISSWPATDFSRLSFVFRILKEVISYHLQFGALHQMIFQPNMTFTHSQRTYRTFRRMRGAGPLGRSPIWLEQPFDGPNQDFLRNPFKPDPLLDLYIKKIVELTKQKNIRLILAYGPIANSVRTRSSEDWLNAAFRHISAITDPHANVLNLLKPIWLLDQDFTDATHLKWSRAMDFSRELSKDLKSCGGG